MHYFSFGLAINAAKKAKRITAVSPPAAALIPPVKIPKMPMASTSFFTSIARRLPNPVRGLSLIHISTSGVDLSALSADNMARKHPDWILTYNNAMYYNPAKEEVKQYITDTVAEVVENYDVDAIHFDDYFYPCLLYTSQTKT